MANTGSRRNHAKAAERLLPPFQEDIALVVTFHLQTYVFAKSVIITKVVNGHGVVNHEVNGRKRIHFCRIASEALNGFAHSG